MIMHDFLQFGIQFQYVRCFSCTRSRMKDLGSVNNALDVHHIILDVARVVQDGELCKLRAPAGHVHVGLRPLEGRALVRRPKGLHHVSVVALVDEDEGYLQWHKQCRD